MTRLFGLADIVAALLFIASFYQVDIPQGMVMALGIYLILKGILFIKNFFSWIDIAAGIILVFALASSLPALALIGLAVFLGLKGLISLISF